MPEETLKADLSSALTSPFGLPFSRSGSCSPVALQVGTLLPFCSSLLPLSNPFPALPRRWRGAGAALDRGAARLVARHGDKVCLNCVCSDCGCLPSVRDQTLLLIVSGQLAARGCGVRAVFVPTCVIWVTSATQTEFTAAFSWFLSRGPPVLRTWLLFLLPGMEQHQQ